MTTRRSFFRRVAAAIGAFVFTPFAAKAIQKTTPRRYVPVWITTECAERRTSAEYDAWRKTMLGNYSNDWEMWCDTENVECVSVRLRKMRDKPIPGQRRP